VVDATYVLWKRAFSHVKREWELADYPVRMRVQKDVPDENRYWARVLGWNIDGLGSTPVEAMRELRRCYQMRKAALAEEGKTVPRPGTKVPIQFASQDRVGRRVGECCGVRGKDRALETCLRPGGGHAGDAAID
jgi:hypothetical protein